MVIRLYLIYKLTPSLKIWSKISQWDNKIKNNKMDKKINPLLNKKINYQFNKKTNN
jgi:hypothetical protein